MTGVQIIQGQLRRCAVRDLFVESKGVLYLSRLRALYLSGRFIFLALLRPSTLHQRFFARLSILNMPQARQAANSQPTNTQPSAGRSRVPSNKVKVVGQHRISFLTIVQSG
jgi:hypothetical protein